MNNTTIDTERLQTIINEALEDALSTALEQYGKNYWAIIEKHAELWDSLLTELTDLMAEIMENQLEVV